MTKKKKKKKGGEGGGQGESNVACSDVWPYMVRISTRALAVPPRLPSHDYHERVQHVAHSVARHTLALAAGWQLRYERIQLCRL